MKNTLCTILGDLPKWWAVWTDYEKEAPLVLRLEDRSDSTTKPTKIPLGPWCVPLSGIEWTSLNAFAARLHVASSLKYLDLRGL
jgi:hypothetical protein